MISNDIEYKFVKPDKSLSDFVESFWMLHNPNDTDKMVVVLPDGRIDMFFSQSRAETFHITLLGIGTNPEQSIIKADTTTFAISFKPLVTEYVLKQNISNLLNRAKNLPDNFWIFSSLDLFDFELFCKKATQEIKSLLPIEIDRRKQKLFELIYNSNGAISVV